MMTKDIEINHSKSVFHIRQSGMQCWVRSSQMVFSWVLYKLEFTERDLEEIFFNSLYPKRFFDHDEERLNKIREFNQMGLGRKLRKHETLEESIDSFFIKIYKEFGESTFVPEIFASIITNYLKILFQIPSFPLKNQKIDIFFDNDKLKEKFGPITYYHFKVISKNAFNTGCFHGSDKILWEKSSNSVKLGIIVDCLKHFPILIETPGHALVLSGFSSKEDHFLVNDSLQNSTTTISRDQVIKYLSTIVMFFRVPGIEE